jgi:PKD repeat protein
MTVPVFPVARVTLNPVSEAMPLTVALDGSDSTDTDGKIVRWEWYFGDGTTALGRNATKTYRQGGNYEATLLVRDTHGGVSIARQSITLKELRLIDPKIDTNGFSFSFPTTSGTYRVEHSKTLHPPDWNSIETILGTGNSETFSRRDLVDPEGYYRVRKE